MFVSCSTTKENNDVPMEVEPTYNKASYSLIQNISGRRLLDISYFFKQMQEVTDHTPFNCNVSHMKMISEKRTDLKSTFLLKFSVSYVISKKIWQQNLSTKS